MSAILRTVLIAALTAGASLAASASPDPARVEQSKREVVRAALQQQGRSDVLATRMDAAASANALCAIRLDVSGERPTVTIETSGTPSYKAFAIPEENKVVLDLSGTVNLCAAAIPSKNDAAIRRIRTSLFAVEPEFVSRVVIDLAVPCKFDVSQDGSIIRVSLLAKSETKRSTCQTADAKAPAPVVERPAVQSEPQAIDVPARSPKSTDIAASIRALAEQAGHAARSAYAGGVSLAMQGVSTAGELERQRVAAQSTALLAQVDETKTSAEPKTECEGDVAARVARLADELDSVQASQTAPVEHLAAELDSVQASQVEMTTPPVVALAAVTEPPSAPPAPVPAPTPISEQPAPAAPPAAPEASASEPPAAPPGAPAAPEAPASEPPAAPAAPAEAGPTEPSPVNAPPPPEKRAEQPVVSGKPIAARMKDLLSGMSAAAKGLGASGLTSATQTEAAPVQEKAAEKKAAPAKDEVVFTGNPMEQIVNIDFRDMDLTNVVALLAQKAQINVIAGADLTGSVTASLKNVTLRKAIDTVLRMNNLGMIEEEGIYRIVPYQEAVATKRKTVMVKIDNGKAVDVQKTLDQILKGSPDDTLLSLSANESTNMLIIAGPETRVGEFESLAKELDVAKPVTQTVTEAIKVNNAEPTELQDLIKSMVSKDIGKVAIDSRSRHIVVTDAPVVLEQVRELIKQIDMPVKQVSVDAMIVDAVLTDNSETGIDWIMKAVHRYNLNGTQVGSLVGPTTGVDSTGDLVQRDVISDMTRAGAGYLSLGLLTDKINIKAAVSAQIDNRNAKLLANPVVVTVENQKASIKITDEIPYQESKQSLTGPPMSSTNFKDIGIELEVTPQVSHDDHVVAKVMAKQSRQNGEFNNIPIEAKRTTDTTLRMKNGQTIFIGGLRRYDDAVQGKKVPVLGDIPVMNFLFRNNVMSKQSSELLVFLTCNVLPDDLPALDEGLQKVHDSLDNSPKIPNSTKELGQILMHSQPKEDPAWHWRRAQ